MEGKCGEKLSNCQLESPDMVVSPANRPSGRGDNCAETGAVTAGLLGATSRPPVCQRGAHPRSARADLVSDILPMTLPLFFLI